MGVDEPGALPRPGSLLKESVAEARHVKSPMDGANYYKTTWGNEEAIV